MNARQRRKALRAGARMLERAGILDGWMWTPAEIREYALNQDRYRRQEHDLRRWAYGYGIPRPGLTPQQYRRVKNLCPWLAIDHDADPNAIPF